MKLRAQGQVVQTMDYTPYGHPLRLLGGASGQARAGYTEKELDGETGLTYFGARYLDAEVGMWTAVDPMGQYHHSYSFVGGDPVNFIDPWGLEGETTNNGKWGSSFWDLFQDRGGTYSDATQVTAKPPEPAPEPTVGQLLSLPEVHSSIPESKLMAPPPGHPDAEPPNHMIARELEEWSNEKYSETNQSRYAVLHSLSSLYLKTTAETEREAILGMGQSGTGSLKTTAKSVIAPVHHIMTNKNLISTARGGSWTPRFADMAKRAGMTLKDAANKIAIAGHRGPHPQAYHEAVFRRLSGATEGLSGDAYSAAFRAELEAIRAEAATTGSALNRMLVP